MTMGGLHEGSLTRSGREMGTRQMIENVMEMRKKNKKKTEVEELSHGLPHH